MENDMRSNGQNGNQPPEKNGLAVASMVLGILSLLLCCTCFVNILLGVLAIIFGLLSKNGQKMNGSAKAGVVLGIIGIILTVLVWGVFFFFFMMDTYSEMYAVPLPVIPEFEELVPEFDNLLFIVPK